MANKLHWGGIGERTFETGISKGVLYKKAGSSSTSFDTGYAWNGLISVTESPSGAEPTDLWADDMKYAVLRSAETHGGTIEAYAYPDEFETCDGSAEIADGVLIGQQSREPFGLAYRTRIGSDTDSDAGTDYKLHLIYNCTVSPTEKNYKSENDSPEAWTASWEYTTTPVEMTGHKPTAMIVIDSTKADATCLAALEAILYGTAAVAAVGTEGSEGYVAAVAAVEPRLPWPSEIITLMTPAG